MGTLKHGPLDATKSRKKSQRQKWEKSLPKNKTDLNKSIEFLGKITLCFGFYRHLAENAHQIYCKNLCFLHQN